jgi:diguanylate cyclase (GGDEF)-like protein
MQALSRLSVAQRLWASFGLLLALPLLLAGAVHEKLPADSGWALVACGAAFAGSALLVVLVVRSVLGPLENAEAGALAMAHTDALTGLALRSRFTAAVEERLQAQAAPGALLCLDVDRLKAVNNLLGFEAGDSLLLGLAQRLGALQQTEGAPCGRLAGGAFVVLLPLAQAEAWRAAVARLQAGLNRKHQWRGQALDLTVSIGVALFPSHGRSAETLLKRAEQAMFEAKRLRADVALYDLKLEADRLSHLSLLSELEAAIAHGQLRQVLQPKRRLADGRVAGAEALVRWQHPERGWLPPSEFVPFAESSGRIRQITQWMLEQAIATLAAWQAEGRDGSIAVNISTLDLQDGQLPQRIEALLRSAGVPAQRLQLELTETGLMASNQDPIHVMHSLRRLGVRLAIDDFGTGQSSLAYLQRLPVHELKIDRSFISGVDRDAQRRELLGSIIMLGHGLGLEVTAEGVETETELALVTRLGCDLAQGYLVGRPCEARHFDAAPVPVSALAG